MVEIVCPDIAAVGGRQPHKPNFPLDRCVQRFRMRAVGCRGCPVGLSWATKVLIWWPMWEKEKNK